MARISIPEGSRPESERLLTIQPEMGKLMGQMADAVYNKSQLDKRVREAVRMKIAQLNQCHICLNYRFPELNELGIDETFYTAVTHWRTSAIFNKREKLALDYTERFINDHTNIDDLFFEKLKQHYSTTEIVELTTSIAALLANGRILQVLQIEQSCAIS